MSEYWNHRVQEYDDSYENKFQTFMLSILSNGLGNIISLQNIQESIEIAKLEGNRTAEHYNYARLWRHILIFDPIVPPTSDYVDPELDFDIDDQFRSLLPQ